MIDTLKYIENDLEKLDDFDISNLNGESVLIIVDLVKGFVNTGVFANEFAKEIIDPIVSLTNKIEKWKKVFFVDSHSEDSLEFNSYPKHCIRETKEEEIIDELIDVAKAENSLIIKKNSVNGFHTVEFKSWLDKNTQIKNFIIVGLVTDICVKNLAISMVTYFNEFNINKNIIVPMNMVETFDAPGHCRKLFNIISINDMKSNGVKVVKTII